METPTNESNNNDNNNNYNNCNDNITDTECDNDIVLTLSNEKHKYENENKLQKQSNESDTVKIDLKNVDVPSEYDVNGPVSKDDYMCVFCLEAGDLIQFCFCTVMAHKDCAIKYIHAPGIMNDKCCMCRRKLEYDVANPNASMKKRYILLLSLIITSVAVFSGLSIYIVMSLIPLENKSMFVYVCIVSNISMTWSLMWLLLICIAVRYGTRSPCRKMSDDFCDCLNDEFVFCELCDMEGMAWSFLILIIYFMAVSIVAVIGAIQVYCVTYAIYKFYKSFDLKSKGGLKFQYERKIVLSEDSCCTSQKTPDELDKI